MANILGWLVPKEKKFFHMLKKQSENVMHASIIFKDLIDNYHSYSESKRHSIITRIKKIEGIGDDMTHNIINEINKSFITPFDREDIFNVAVLLDDVVDLINAIALRLKLYNIQKIHPAMSKLTRISAESIKEVDKSVGHLEDLKRIREFSIKINSLENDADDVFHEAIASILNSKTKIDPIDIIKYKEIIEIHEKVTDKCEHIAHVLEGIVMKHG